MTLPANQTYLHRRTIPLAALLLAGAAVFPADAQMAPGNPAAASAPVTNMPTANTPNAAPATPAMPAEPAPSYAPSNTTPSSLTSSGSNAASAPLPALSAPAPNALGQPLPAAAPASLQLRTPGAVPLVLTPDTAAMLAVRRSLGSLAALRDIFAARAGVRSAAALSPPVFTIGPALQTGGTTDGLLLEQPLELNGTRSARTQVARAQLRLTQAQALTQLQALVYAARTDFYLLARAQEQLRLAGELRQATEQLDALVRKQVALGARPGIDARQSAIEAARARAYEAQSSGEEQATRALLNAYLGRAPLDPISAALPGEANLSTPNLEAAQRQALAARGEIAEAEAARDLPQARASLARAQGRPDLAPEFRISQITPKYMDAGLGVVITVPLDYGTRRELIRQEELTADASAARVTGTEAQVRAETVQAASRLSAARAALAEYDAGIVEDARAVLQAAQTGFAAGALTITDVLSAERTFRLVTSERLSALSQADQASADFDRAAGIIPPALITELQKELTAP